MFYVTRGDAVLGYSQRLGLGLCGNVPLYAFSRLVLSPETCHAHIQGEGLLQLFTGTEIVDPETGERHPLRHILLGDFVLPRTGRPDLVGAAFSGQPGPGEVPSLNSLLVAARGLLETFGRNA